MVSELHSALDLRVQIIYPCPIQLVLLGLCGVRLVLYKSMWRQVGSRSMWRQVGSRSMWRQVGSRSMWRQVGSRSMWRQVGST